MTAPHDDRSFTVDDIVAHINVNADTQAILLVIRDEFDMADRDTMNNELRAVSDYLGVPVAAVANVDHVCVVDR